MQDERAEAANRPFFDGDEHFVLARQTKDEVLVERLGESGIRDRCREPGGVERLGRLEAFHKPGAEREQRNLRALAHDATLADRKRYADLWHVDAHALAARIA